MSIKQVERRSAQGKRLDGKALAVRIAHEVEGLQLAHAFVLSRSAGFPLKINKHNGVLREGTASLTGADHIVVNVIGGAVVAGWVE